MTDLELPRWQFVPRQPMSKQRDPIQGEFFNTESITTVADEVVREAVQNTLDAATDAATARVRFYVSGDSGALSEQEAARYFQNLQQHALACGAPTDLLQSPCRFVVVEDFGTTGLTGDESSSDEPAPSTKNDFFYFFRAEGKSGKSGASRGRWGVGKYVFPKASNANAFFAVTARQQGSKDSPGLLLMGQAVMKNHKVAEKSFEPDGWWAVFTTDGLPIPESNSATIVDFRSSWQIERTDEPGLSVVIPYADPSLTADQVLRSVARDYFVAVLAASLIVEIDGPDLAGPVTVSPATISDVIDKLESEDEREQLRRNCDLVQWGLHAGSDHTIDLTAPVGSPTWSPDLLPSQERDRLKALLGADENVLVHVPVTIGGRSDGTTRSSSFDVLLAPEAGLRRLPLFVREGIIVSEAVQSGRLQGIRAIVLVHDGVLADLLGDAEGPAHTSWSEKTEGFRDKYQYAARWLPFVRQAPSKILDLAHSGDEEEDRTIAVDFFSVASNQGNQSTADGPSQGPQGVSPSLPTPPTTSPRKIAVSRTGDGFTVSLTPAGSTVRRVEILAAYDRRNGNPFRHWTADDFCLSSGQVHVNDGTLIKCEGNCVLVDVTNQKTFSVRINGFDINRDVRVTTAELVP